MNNESKIFVAYRVLGFVSNNVPLSLRFINRRNENLVVTCVGKSFHTYGCSKLNLLSVSGQHPDDISCLTSNSFLVYTACKNVIYAWRRGTDIVHTYEGPTKNVHLMLPFAEYLIAIYEDNTLLMWDVKSEEIFREIVFEDFSISAIVHPSAYLNKILLGSRQGTLQLWNLRTNKLIHSFDGWGSAVTVLEQAPAADVVAIGLENGEIYIHNLKFGETIVKFSQEWGAVTALSFRTDGPAIMASGSTTGHIAVWDLEKKRLHSEIRDAHSGSVSGLKFLPNEPLLITNSNDNSIKMWIFDLPDDGGRLLRLREGHGRPPLKIQFYGTDGKNILSAGLDSTLRSFSTEVDNMNKSLGQASYNRKAAKKKGVKNDPGKMLPVVHFDSDTTREKDWDNIASVHRHTRVVTTWSYDNCRMGQHKLIHDRFKGVKKVEALCTSISACGNFVVIGYNTGHIDKFNIQSGLHRGAFGKETAHDGSVRCLVLDGINSIVVSGGSDKLLKFWKFRNHSLITSLEFKSGISKMIIHRESNLVAVALDDFSVVLVDLDTLRIVRMFEEHEGSITDLTFSPGPRWLIVATMDSAIKTWDLKTGRLIDWFLVPAICTSLSMSPTGEYLATTHTGSVGIYLWANITLYSYVSLYPLPDSYDPLMIELPGVTLEGRDSSDDESCDDNIVETESPKPNSSDTSVEQLSSELISLSLMPPSHWLDLPDLDIIKRRNKPKEPVQVPKSAPFFLPVVSGLNPTFQVDESKDAKTDSEKSKILQVRPHSSEFSLLLESCISSENYSLVMEKLKSLTPSKIDVEIRCLSPENGGSIHLMECFLKTIFNTISSKKDFELAYSYLYLFLQVHYDVLASENIGESVLEQLKEDKSWEKLEEKINYCLCVINYLKSAVL